MIVPVVRPILAVILINKPPQMWADAVCINQTDLDERSSQVTIMCDIYKDARNCQIWLGTVEEIKTFLDENLVSELFWSYL